MKNKPDMAIHNYQVNKKRTRKYRDTIPLNGQCQEIVVEYRPWGTRIDLDEGSRFLFSF
jgi:hypothetical protein